MTVVFSGSKLNKTSLTIIIVDKRSNFSDRRFWLGSPVADRRPLLLRLHRRDRRRLLHLPIARGSRLQRVRLPSFRLPTRPALGLRKEAVLDVQLGVHLSSRRASERFRKRLLEVVTEEGVQDRVHCRVGVRQTLGQQHHGEGEGGLAGVRGHEGQPELGAPVREPAQDVHGDHAEDQVGDLAVGSLLFLASVLRADVPEAADHQEVEEKDEDEGYGESKGEGVQAKRHFAVHVRALRPVDVAIDVAALLQRAGVHVYRYHEQCG